MVYSLPPLSRPSVRSKSLSLPCDFVLQAGAFPRTGVVVPRVVISSLGLPSLLQLHLFALRGSSALYHSPKPRQFHNPVQKTTMSHTGTLRGTPKNRNQVHYTNSPSNIPRPALDSHVSHAAQSEAGTSTLSASRAKQSKRDEVSRAGAPFGRWTSP